MNTTSEQAEFLNWKLTPARLNATQAAWFLGFEPDEITILVGAGLLKPLGHPRGTAASSSPPKSCSNSGTTRSGSARRQMRSLTTGNSATRARRQRAHRARTGMEHTGESPCSIRLARRDQRSLIPHHAHAPAPSPPGGGRFAALRSRSSRKATWERHLRRASV